LTIASERVEARVRLRGLGLGELGLLARLLGGRVLAIARRDDATHRERAARDHRDQRRGRDAHRRAVGADPARELLALRIMMRRDELTADEALQIVGELARAAIALVALERERLVDDRRELGRHAGHALAQRLRGPVDRGAHHVGGVLRVVRRPAREQVIERRAERVDVAALVGWRAAQLFGRDEARGAEHDARARLDDVAVVLVDRRQRARLGIGDVGFRLAERLREAPVDQHRLAELADEDVRRLDVAVNDAAFVGVRDRVGGGDQVRQELEAIDELRILRDEVLERAAADLAHHVKRRAGRRRARVVNRHDRRMLEPRGDPGLALEPPDRVRIAR
jgi:hypothetical protein